VPAAAAKTVDAAAADAVANAKPAERAGGLACDDGVDHAVVLAAARATLVYRATKLNALPEAIQVGLDQYMEAVTV
jgi:hypothetical protein